MPEQRRFTRELALSSRRCRATCSPAIVCPCDMPSQARRYLILVVHRAPTRHKVGAYVVHVRVYASFSQAGESIGLQWGTLVQKARLGSWPAWRDGNCLKIAPSTVQNHKAARLHDQGNRRILKQMSCLLAAMRHDARLRRELVASTGTAM